MLKQQITDAMKAAMKSGDKTRLGVVRLMLAAIKQREVDERVELDDSQVLAVLDKMVKQRRDSIKQYGDAGRDDLVAQEAAEIEVIQEFLPAGLSEAEAGRYALSQSFAGRAGHAQAAADERRVQRHHRAVILRLALQRQHQSVAIDHAGGGGEELGRVAPGDGYELEIAHFLKAVLGEAVPPVLTLASSRNAIRIVNAEKKSIKTGQTVALG